MWQVLPEEAVFNNDLSPKFPAFLIMLVSLFFLFVSFFLLTFGPWTEMIEVKAN